MFRPLAGVGVAYIHQRASAFFCHDGYLNTPVLSFSCFGAVAWCCLYLCLPVCLDLSCLAGHGGSVADKDGDEADNKDETMVPVDYKSSGQITDDEILKEVRWA